MSLDDAEHPASAFDARIASTAASGDASPAGSRTRRESLSRWIARTTGHHLDVRSDVGFCEGLWDGVVLCRILEKLAPGAVAQPLRADDPRLREHDSPDTYVRRHNYERFVAGAARVGVKPGDMFALRDLGEITGAPSGVLRCLEAVRATVGDAKTTNERRGECTTPTTVVETADAAAFETPPPTVHVPRVDFARLSRSSGSTEASTETRTGASVTVTGPSLSFSPGLPGILGEGSGSGCPPTSSPAETSSRRSPNAPPDTTGSAGSSFASPRSSSCSTVRVEDARSTLEASSLSRGGTPGGGTSDRRDAPLEPLDGLSAELESAESAARAVDYERRLEDAARELADGRERLTEAFRREARATARAENAERRAEKALAHADRLSRENDALRRLEKAAERTEAPPFRTERLLDADRLSARDDDAAAASLSEASLSEASLSETSLSVRLEATARERDEALRELEMTRETLASATGAAKKSETALFRVSARLRRAETALRNVRDATVPALRDALAATRRDAARRALAEAKRFADDLAAATSRLAARAALYEAAAAENKKLRLAIQDLKGSVRVFCRVRPAVPGSENGASANDDRLGDRPAVEATTDADGAPTRLVVTRGARRGANPKPRRSFSFDRAFGPEASQADVYEVCEPLVRGVVDGHNACLLAYGQTGSGKTHTMSGPPRCDGGADRGVVHRALDDVFAFARARRAVATHVVTVSVLEIYNETCRDLLADDRRGGGTIDVGAEAKIGADGANVPDATARVVRDAEDVWAATREGEARRSTGATAMNARSSRSHAVVIVRVDATSHETRARTRGALYLVDLAGSERVSRSEAAGDRLKEARHINKSLSALGDVIAALRGRAAHVPYRNSKLTTLLRGALGPNGKAALFAHVSPSAASADESVSTLTFAERAAAVELGRARKVFVERDERRETPNRASIVPSRETRAGRDANASSAETSAEARRSTSLEAASTPNREADDAELRRQAAAAAISAAEATPAALRDDGASENRRADVRSAEPETPPPASALSPLSALANASFAEDVSPPSFSLPDASARAADAAMPLRGTRVACGARPASAAASRWRSAYTSAAAAHETDSVRKKRSMYSRAAAAFGFAKKTPTARGRWR